MNYVMLSNQSNHSRNYWKSILNLIGMQDFEVIVASNVYSDIIPDYVIFDGGHDVTPLLYGEENVASSVNYERDIHELGLFELFLRDEKTKYIGICRGSQFLNVACEGSLIQDLQYKHAYSHEVNIVNKNNSTLLDYIPDDKFVVNSTHHQASLKLGWLTGLYTTLIHKKYQTIEGFESGHRVIFNDKYVPKIKAVQSHPEYTDREYINSEKVLKYLFSL